MTVRMIDDFGEFKRGHLYDVSIELARELIGKGRAVKKENARSAEATEALNAARVKDDK